MQCKENIIREILEDMQTIGFSVLNLQKKLNLSENEIDFYLFNCEYNGLILKKDLYSNAIGSSNQPIKTIFTVINKGKNY